MGDWPPSLDHHNNSASHFVNLPDLRNHWQLSTAYFLIRKSSVVGNCQ